MLSGTGVPAAGSAQFFSEAKQADVPLEDRPVRGVSAAPRNPPVVTSMNEPDFRSGSGENPAARVSPGLFGPRLSDLGLRLGCWPDVSVFDINVGVCSVFGRKRFEL